MTSLHTPGPAQAAAYTAQWIWCPKKGLMRDKWVHCEKGRIKELCAARPQGVESFDLGEGLLMPGLINAHTHLELSFMAGQIPPQGDFVGWMTDLVELRPGHDPNQAAQTALAAARASAASGVCLAGDISNTGRAMEAWHRAGVSAITFWEALGIRQIGPEQESLEWQGGVLCAQAMAAHAPYTVPAPRIQLLKSRAQKLPFCIHAAESRAEGEFIRGSGEEGTRLAEFLLARGVDVSALGICGATPLEHLFNLDVVDQNTLLVHGVQLEGMDIIRLAASQASLCVCPRSNLGLTGSIAPVPALLEAGVNLALGTDSLASCPDLSLWPEMRTLLDLLPDLSPEKVLYMATLGGARALGQGEHYGSLAPGKKAALCFRAAPDASSKDILESAIRAA